VSSVPFTSLWGHDAATDSWAGFPVERAGLLDVLHTVPNVIILSGDRHEFAAVELNSGRQNAHRVLEFSTSPLSMFYIPFFRSLRMQSNSTVQMKTKSGSETQRLIEVPQERVLKYIPAGNYKW